MIRRYFIECPLEAALAAKNHGFIVGHCHGKHGLYTLTISEILEDMNDDPLGKLYIAEESLVLLEPVVGDAIMWDYHIDCGTSYAEIIEIHDHTVTVMMDWLEDATGEVGIDEFFIIRRDNKHFPTIRYEDVE